MRPQHILPLWVAVDLRVMAIKEYYILYRSPELESHHQMQFSVTQNKPFEGVLSFCSAYTICMR